MSTRWLPCLGATVVGLLELDWREVVAVLGDAAVVEPVDPFQGRDLDLLAGVHQAFESPAPEGQGERVLIGSTMFHYFGVWRQSKCDHCENFAMWRGDRLLYPSGATVPPPHDDMPEAVVPLYQEAREVANVSRRGGAALVVCFGSSSGGQGR